MDPFKSFHLKSAAARALRSALTAGGDKKES